MDYYAAPEEPPAAPPPDPTPSTLSVPKSPPRSQQARQARAYARKRRGRGRQAADNARAYGSSNPRSGSGYFEPSGDFAGDRARWRDSREATACTGSAFMNGQSTPTIAFGAAALRRPFRQWARCPATVSPSWRNGTMYLGAWASGPRGPVMAPWFTRAATATKANGPTANATATASSGMPMAMRSMPGYWSNGSFTGSGYSTTP